MTGQDESFRREASKIAWELEHSVETDASPSFAWRFCTDPTNWDDPPAQFTLDGPFAAGSQGTTLMPDQEPRRWRIRDVRLEQSYVIETELDGATMSFEWRFEPVSEHRTRLTQRIVLSGDNAAVYEKGVEEGFGSTLAPGMERIAAAIAAAEATGGAG